MLPPRNPGPNPGNDAAAAAMCGNMGQHPSMAGNHLPFGLAHPPMAPHGMNQIDMNVLNNTFAGMDVPNGQGLRATDIPLPGLPLNSPPLNMMPTHGNGQQQGLLLMHNGVVYAPANVAPYGCLPSPNRMGGMPTGPDRWAPRMGPYHHRAGLMHDFGATPVTPTPRVFAHPPEHVAGEPPGLDDRQISIGSHSDEQVSSPDTPDAIDASRLGQNVVIARADLSPLVQYGYGALSPHHFMPHLESGPMGKTMALRQLTNDLLAITGANPAIPRAVPAVSSCRKTLQSCFENPTGTTNVYIRGLHPNTSDDMLLAYAARFGHVENSKAMIDNQTGACKGFGFACYRTLEEAQNCIRGFYFLGYEVSFARESFNGRLKSLSDPDSTNLYVSNLPRSMTEGELEAIFHDFKVQSSRIIRDGRGHSKGVGFARFASREECDAIIQKYHGQAIGQEQLLLQVRYADTPEQKRLKQETQKRREFRANEYNAVAYGGSALYPFRPVRSDILEAQLAAARVRPVDMSWMGFGTPNMSAMGRTTIASEPPVNRKVDYMADSKPHPESDVKPRISGPRVDENTPVIKNSPSIAYGDTYSTQASTAIAAEA